LKAHTFYKKKYTLQKWTFFDIILNGLYNQNIKSEVYMAHLNAKAVKQIEEIIARYQDEKTPLMMILSDIQHEFGYIPLDVQEIISEKTGIPVAEIYGVVTFYSFFSLTPKGKYVIGVCLGTACYVKGSQQVLDKFSELLNIKAGETTEDGLFTLDALRCIGACGIAPALTINGKVYPKVAVADVAKIVEEYRSLGGNE
jgi:NADH-quinone oxidoreductase subunit E/NADP-reducing hydrogenase subunit HndA